MKTLIGIALVGLFFLPIARADAPTSPKLPTVDTSLHKMIIDTFGKDAPKMEAIIACESSGVQTTNNIPLLSKTNDTGLTQINISNWKKAVELGLDIWFSPLDNLKFAKYILDTQGFSAWTTYKTPCYYRNLVKDS